MPLRHSAFEGEVTREQLVAWYRAARERTRSLFDLLVPDAYYDRPIALRNPIVFYEGHLPAFAVNTLVKLALQRPGIDPDMETLFARGIDPEDEASAKSPTDLWPSREEIQRYARAADELIEDVLRNARLDDASVPHLRNGEAVFTILEHELMHHETLLYMFHELPHSMKIAAPPLRISQHDSAGAPRKSRVTIPTGQVFLGNDDRTFGWDNEFPACAIDVAEFTIDSHDVTNGDYLEYMQATGAKAPHFWARGEREWCWRGMFEMLPLDSEVPVYVTHDEAEAYAKWSGGRLPTEAELQRAMGTGAGEGNYDLMQWDPLPAGSFAPNEWGLYDITGNGWEWTSTLFAPFAGFQAMPSYPVYSADFFDDAHYVLKGASPATARELVRPGFRNWFRPAYPYVYATFRCVR
jgi:iron(II)-dependent oxidoreductase